MSEAVAKERTREILSSVTHERRDAKLSWREMLSYGGGSVASNLSWNMVAGFLIVYYTDIALLPVAAVGTLVLLTRIFDAFIDPVVGVLVDRTRTRFGKARPYVLYASVPFAILCVLTFSVPEGSTATKLIYAYATFGLLGVAYSFLYVPYGALQPLMTSNQDQLLRLSSVRAMGTSVASIIVYALVLPIVTWFGAGDQGRGYFGASAVFAAITAMLYWITFLNCRERGALATQANSPNVLRDIRNLLRNEIWIIAMIFEVLIFIRLGALVPAMAYYARETLHLPWLTSVLLPVMSVAILTGGLFSPWYLARFRKRRGMIMALIFTIACFALLPFCRSSVWLLLAVFFLAMISNGAQATMVFTMIAEAVDLQEARSGTRQEGLVSSSAALTQKIGFAVGSALVAYVLAFAGYSPHEQRPEVATALTWLVSGAPIVVALLQMVCISFYDFDHREARTPRGLPGSPRTGETPT